MRLFVLDLGRMEMARSLLVQPRGTAPAGDRASIPIAAYCLDHPEGRLLFDAGCNPEAMGPEGRWPQAFQAAFPWSGDADCYLPNRLKQLGWGPDDFDLVVLSHLHCDHCGCVEYFRRSTLVVQRAEYTAAQQALARQDATEGYMPKDIAQWRKLPLKWHLVAPQDGDRDLWQGVRLLNWGPGHSHGMLGLLVRLPRHGSVILASDAVYCQDNYGPPVRPQGVMLQAAAWRRTLNRIRSLADAEAAEVWFGHDLSQFESLTLSTAGCYE